MSRRRSVNRKTEWRSGIRINSIQSLSRVWLFVTLWTAAHQASLSITNSRSFLKLMSIVSVMPSNHLILCRPLRLLPSIFPSIRVFSNESVLLIRWSTQGSIHKQHTTWFTSLKTSLKACYRIYSFTKLAVFHLMSCIWQLSLLIHYI